MKFHSVEFEAPADWLDMSVVSVVSPEPRAFRPNIVVTRDPLEPGTDVATYARGESKELQKSSKKYTLHKAEDVALGGRNGFLIDHSFRSNENVMVRQLQVFVARSGTVHVLALTCADGDFASMSNVFDSVLSTFKLI